MNEANIGDQKDSVVARLRMAYLAGKSIDTIVRDEVSFRAATPLDVMLTMMEAFHIGLGDVSCIDGWWPPDSKSEVTDENLDLFVREAIEEHRADWNIEGK